MNKVKPFVRVERVISRRKDFQVLDLLGKKLLLGTKGKTTKDKVGKNLPHLHKL